MAKHETERDPALVPPCGYNVRAGLLLTPSYLAGCIAVTGATHGGYYTGKGLLVHMLVVLAFTATAVVCSMFGLRQIYRAFASAVARSKTGAFGGYVVKTVVAVLFAGVLSIYAHHLASMLGATVEFHWLSQTGRLAWLSLTCAIGVAFVLGAFSSLRQAIEAY